MKNISKRGCIFFDFMVYYYACLKSDSDILYGEISKWS